MHLLLFACSIIPALAATVSRPPHLTNDGPYEPQCHRVDRAPPHPIPGLSPTSCFQLIHTVCLMIDRIPASEVRRRTWIWTSEPGCALGYYLEPGEELPDEVECQFLIYKTIVDDCGHNSRFNSGGINVGVMPNLTSPGTAAIDPLANRYIMAPTPLTWVEDSVRANATNSSTISISES